MYLQQGNEPLEHPKSFHFANNAEGLNRENLLFLLRGERSRKKKKFTKEDTRQIAKKTKEELLATRRQPIAYEKG